MPSSASAHPDVKIKSVEGNSPLGAFVLPGAGSPEATAVAMSFSNGHRLSSVEENNHLGFMWKKLVRGYREFVADDPGVRFLNTYKRWNQSNASPVAGIAVIGIGVALILVGVLLALVPGVPGIVLGVLGLALIATRFRLMALWLDWTEIKCRKIWSKLRHRNAAG